MSAELAVLGAEQGDITRFAEQVVTGIGFVCAAFILSRALKSQSCQHSGQSFYVRRDRNHSGLWIFGLWIFGLWISGLWISDRSNRGSCHYSRLPSPWTRSTFGGGR